MRSAATLPLACFLSACLSGNEPFESEANLFAADEVEPLSNIYRGSIFNADIMRTAFGGYLAIVHLNGNTWLASRQDLGEVEFHATAGYVSTMLNADPVLVLLNHRTADDPEWLQGPKDGSYAYFPLVRDEEDNWFMLFPDAPENAQVDSRSALNSAMGAAKDSGEATRRTRLYKVNDVTFQLYLNEVVRGLGVAMGNPEASAGCDKGFAFVQHNMGTGWLVQSLAWMNGAVHSAFRSERTMETEPGVGTRTRHAQYSQMMRGAVRFTNIGADPASPRVDAPMTDLLITFPEVVSTDPDNPMPKILDIMRGSVAAKLHVELNGAPFVTLPLRSPTVHLETGSVPGNFKVGVRVRGRLAEEQFGKLYQRLHEAADSPQAALTHYIAFGDGRRTPIYETLLADLRKADARAYRNERRMRMLCVGE